MPDNKNKRKPAIVDVWKRFKRNKVAVAGLCGVILLIFISIFAEYLIPYDYAAQDANSLLLAPCREHWFGTDNFGRDIFSRILYGTKYTMFIAVGCTTFSAILGTSLGVLAGYYPKLDNLIMRFTDILMGIPTLILSLSLIMLLGTGLMNVIIALSIATAPSFIRVIRAQVLTIKDQEFIEAARATGASDLRIIFKYLLPNTAAMIIIQYTLGAVSVILWAASLSFLGLGVQAPMPEWGLMINTGRTFLRSAWWMTVFPGLAIMLATFSLNLMGDGLRDALDPKLK